MAVPNSRRNNPRSVIGIIALFITALLILLTIVFAFGFSGSNGIITDVGLVVGILSAFFGFLQAFPIIRDEIIKVFSIRPSLIFSMRKLTIILTALVVTLLVLNIIQASIIFGRGGQKQPTTIVPLPTHTTSATQVPTKTPGQTDDSVSSLIPPNTAPVIEDPLIDNSKGNQWDVVDEHYQNKYRSCLFQGGAYHLKASAKYGIGCNTNAPSTDFVNIVYQVKMIFFVGSTDMTSGGGPTFGVNPQDNSKFFKVSFSRSGQWSVFTPKNPNSPFKSGSSSFFHGDDQHPNYITIKLLNTQIDIQINGNPLYSFTDPTYIGGYLGVLMYADMDGADVAFSDVGVWQLQ